MSREWFVIHSDWKSPEMRLFKAGLKQDPNRLVNLTKNSLNRPSQMHEKIDYERVIWYIIKGAVIHSRSSANQYFNFHYMFGGFRKYVIQRWWIQHFYRKSVRGFWLPVLVAYGIGCYGMRQYDNAAANFFYFSDWDNYDKSIRHTIFNYLNHAFFNYQNIMKSFDFNQCKGLMKLSFSKNPSN